MKIEKTDVCMTAVNVVKNTMRDFGAVCGNCEYMNHEEGGIGCCELFLREMNAWDSFCSMFQFRDDKSCKGLYERIVNYENDRGSHESDELPRSNKTEM